MTADNVKTFMRADNDTKAFPPHYNFAEATGVIIGNLLLEGREARGIPNPARNIHKAPSADSNTGPAQEL